MAVMRGGEFLLDITHAIKCLTIGRRGIWQGLKRQLAEVAVSDDRHLVANKMSPPNARDGTDRHKETKAKSPAASRKTIF